MAISERELLQTIIASMKEAGYDPYDQLYGYYTTGENSYITRRNNAREMISKVSKENIKEYLQENEKK